MVTNNFFNNFNSSGEQDLIESLIVESIRIYGIDVFYIARDVDHTKTHYDAIENDTRGARFNAAYMIDMYIRNIDGFGGDGTLMSKFGIEIRDQITFTVAARTFDYDVSQQTAHDTAFDNADHMFSHTIHMPREGDLIYLPLNKKVFEIKFSEHESIFYQLGALQVFDLKCELFEYSGEIFETGILEIDSYFQKADEGIFTTDLEKMGEELEWSDNFIVQKEGEKFLDQDETTPDAPFGW